MTLKQEKVLTVLRGVDGPMTSREIRDAAGLSGSISDVTRTCKALERYGFVERHVGHAPVNGWVQYSWTIAEEER